MRSDSLHVTFAFLGEIDEERAEVAGELVRSVEPRRVRMRLGSEIRGLPRKRPRVLALDEVGGEVGGLQADVAVSLAEVGVLGPERRPSRRPFWSHMTVARLKRGALGGRSVASFISTVAPPDGEVIGTHDAAALTLFRSELGRGPATYTALATVELTGGGG